MYKQSNFSNTIFYSDLDGTLLNNNARLAPKCYADLQKLIDDGLLFSVASARNLNTIRNMLNGIHLSLPVVNLNGAYISDINTMRHIQINGIEKNIKKNISEIIERNNLGVFISNHQKNKDGILYYGLKNHGEHSYLCDRQNSKDQILVAVDQLSEAISSEVTCFTFIDRKEKLEELKAFIIKHNGHGIKTHLFENQYSKGWFWLTVHSHLATKSNALQFIKQEYDYTDKLLTVFGDGINDVEMFELADTAISVNNAIPIIKEKSDVVIGSNNEGSVVNYLNQLKKQSVEF
ncbi:HAD-IIB family hydrolase [Flavivirga rizhaonensis]|uniref:HAD-IIB family hydrolase n=1 Tax=Flavivirga rizhaonensis TaxID=2559571 RepID=A0A4S1DU17_9FLAO|nr:HAD-IIB family hydrolase [Flavivirga rizhaonensis]TGV01551.1 HAD-IIB family hydrolase [Flavivirga rizhaonensis]